MTNTPAREGLPELPAEVFVAITRGEGYEDVCDQLLAEDAFGPNNPFEWRVVDAAALGQPAQGGGEESPHWAFAAAYALRPFVNQMVEVGSTSATDRSHCLWMIERMNPSAMSATKACRWLGWIQSALCDQGVMNLPAAKDHNAKFSALAALHRPQPEMGSSETVDKLRAHGFHNAAAIMERHYAAPPPPRDAPHWANLPGGVDPEDYEDETPSDAAQGVQPVRVDEARILSVEEIAIAKAAEHPLEFVTVRTADLRATLAAHKGEGN